MPTQQTAVQARIADPTGDRATQESTYWGARRLDCSTGDRVVLEVPPLSGRAQNHSNGSATFDASGNAIGGGGVKQKAPETLRDPRFLCPGLAQHSLIGRFGEKGVPFTVGDRHEGTADGDGLFLTVNDTVGSFGSNSGSYTVSVTVTPVGGALTFRAGTVLEVDRSYPVAGTSVSLCFQQDNNLVVYRDTTALWALNGEINTWHQSSPRCEFTADGDLVVSGGGRDLWSTKTGGHPNAVLGLDGQGVLSITDGSAVLWTSGRATA